MGHVIKELDLKNEELDIDFVLSKSNINLQDVKQNIQIQDIKHNERIDLTDKISYKFKNWSYKNSPIVPIIHLDKNMIKHANFGFTLILSPKD